MISTIIVQLLSIILLAPLFDGILKRFKAFLNGRRGASVFQTYYDLLKLFQKEQIINRHTSFMTTLAPMVICSVFLVAAFFVPVIRTSVISINLIYLFYLFALGTFFLILYGMDAGTYFGGLGGSRELFLAFLLEPIILVLIAMLYGSFSSMDVSGLAQGISTFDHSPYSVFLLIIFAAAFAIVFLGENTRFPFDNPATHLELTMIHEAMLLETGGPALALLEYAAKIKIVTFMTLFLDLFMPFSFGLSSTVSLWILWFAEMLVLIAILGKFEVYITKLRIFRYQNYTGVMLILLMIMFLFHLYFI